MDQAEASPATKMSQHFFISGTCVALDYTTAVQANTTRQNFSVIPRDWYIDARITCKACDVAFLFATAEQKHWYEDLGFYVDSFPNRCPVCRRNTRELTRLRQQYDATISSALSEPDTDLKQRTVALIDMLVATGLEIPAVILERRASLIGQLQKLNDKTTANDH
ncbi:zinc-ribbon domain-containing protein [bacterium]|nr:zinc-ribbon domain-containing protein [bacterium]